MPGAGEGGMQNHCLVLMEFQLGLQKMKNVLEMDGGDGLQQWEHMHKHNKHMNIMSLNCTLEMVKLKKKWLSW